jgi:hypothetical protein
LDPDRIDYPSLIQEALRGVVRQVLEQVAEHGLPGDHFLYIGFRSQHPGVQVPRFLRDQYPEEMTIILQHQFWDLAVTPEAFSVVLRFNAVSHRLTVPFAALTAFADPPAEFGLRFESAAGPATAGEPRPATDEPAPLSPSDPGGVLRFDPSRRK